MSETFTTLGALRSFTSTGRTLMLDYGGPLVAITMLTERMVRVRLAPEGKFAARRSWAVALPDEAFSETSFEIEDSEQAIIVRTSALAVRIERERGNISFADMQGQRFCAE